MQVTKTQPIPGLPTLKNLLTTALQPVGSTMYIYGGGWNEADDGSGEDSVRIGVNPHWREYFLAQGPDYDFNTTRYQLGDGLDCSGYIGWSLYNIFQIQSGNQGYVMKAADMAQTFAGFGWGDYLLPEQLQTYRPGDIMSMPGHVWLALGQCDDGSVAFLHSSPCGVQLGATPTPQGAEHSQALALVTYYMARYFPDWHQKYPCYGRGLNYLQQSAALRWYLDGQGVLLDPDGFRDLTPRQLLEALLGD